MTFCLLKVEYQHKIMQSLWLRDQLSWRLWQTSTELGFLRWRGTGLSQTAPTKPCP